MLSFQRAVLRVRNFYEGDSENDILMRLIDNLREDVDNIRNKQKQVVQDLTHVVSFIEKIDANMLRGGSLSQALMP